jgi:hypothetical protein
MNLPLLIKLVKLANNNPNDNEANSAARRVCKMIAEANYIFTSDSYNAIYGGARAPGKNVVNNPPPVYKSASNPTYNPFEELFKGVNRESYKNGSWRFENNPFKDSTYKGVDWGKQPFTPPSQNVKDYTYPGPEYDPITGKKKEKPRRILKCKICKKEVNTIFQGLEELFECNTCIWEAYARGNK